MAGETRGCDSYKTLKTPRCEVKILRKCTPDYIRGLRLAHGFGYFINPASGVEPLALAASRGDYVALAVHEGEIVGFLVAYRLSLEGLPAHVAFENIYDIATEVSRKWRKMGIGSTLLEATVNDPFFEDKVLVIRGNPDYWDCYGDECRKYAMFIMEIPVMYYGFQKLPVTLPGDLFTIARIGPKAGVTLEELTSLFLKLARGIESEFYPF